MRITKMTAEDEFGGQIRFTSVMGRLIPTGCTHRANDRPTVLNTGLGQLAPLCSAYQIGLPRARKSLINANAESFPRSVNSVGPIPATCTSSTFRVWCRSTGAVSQEIELLVKKLD
jgi:hypothetical protein